MVEPAEMSADGINCVKNNIGDDSSSNRINNDNVDVGVGKDYASTEVNSRDHVEKNQERGAGEVTTGRRYRIGYWMTEKKERRLNFYPFCDICRELGIDIIKLRFDIGLEEQGPFDLILHKITDQVALTADGTVKTSTNIDSLKRYLARHPHIEVVDPIDSVMLLLDRHRQYRYVVDEDKRLGVDQQDKCYFIPSFAEFTSKDVEENKRKMREQNVQFPFVCKPSLSHCQAQAVDPTELSGPGYVTCQGRDFILCHSPKVEREEMAIVFNEDGLQDLEPPCVAQTFINHNARLFKVFIIGNRTYMLTRPSIKNFYPSDQKTIFFNSNDVSKSYSSSFLNKLDADDAESLPLADPEPKILDEIVADLQSKLNLEFLGIDVIIENGTGRYAVIDINAFPGYDGVAELFPAMLDLLCRRLSITHIDIPRVFAEYGHPYLPPDPSGIRTRIISSDEGPTPVSTPTVPLATIAKVPVSNATIFTETDFISTNRTFDDNKSCNNVEKCDKDETTPVSRVTCIRKGFQGSDGNAERAYEENSTTYSNTNITSFSEGTVKGERNDDAKHLSGAHDTKAIIEINRNTENWGGYYRDGRECRMNGVTTAVSDEIIMNGLNKRNDAQDDIIDRKSFVSQFSADGAILQFAGGNLSPPAAKRYIVSSNIACSHGDGSPSNSLSDGCHENSIDGHHSISHHNTSLSEGHLSNSCLSDSHLGSSLSDSHHSDGYHSHNLDDNHSSNSLSDGNHSNALIDGSCRNNRDNVSHGSSPADGNHSNDRGNSNHSNNHGNSNNSNGIRDALLLGNQSGGGNGSESLIVLTGFGMN